VLVLREKQSKRHATNPNAAAIAGNLAKTTSFSPVHATDLQIFPHKHNNYISYIIPSLIILKMEPAEVARYADLEIPSQSINYTIRIRKLRYITDVNIYVQSFALRNQATSILGQADT
jgi:hypothetical protein